MSDRVITRERFTAWFRQPTVAALAASDHYLDRLIALPHADIDSRHIIARARSAELTDPTPKEEVS